MVSSLGLTTKEIEKLKNTSVSTGDVVTATFQVVADRLGINFSDIRKWFGESLDFMTKMGRWALAALYAEWVGTFRGIGAIVRGVFSGKRSEEHTSELQSLMRISYAVFCLQKKKNNRNKESTR